MAAAWSILMEVLYQSNMGHIDMLGSYIVDKLTTASKFLAEYQFTHELTVAIFLSTIGCLYANVFISY